MSAKPKVSSRQSLRAIPAQTGDAVTLKAPLTLDEYLHRVEALGKRIDAYIQFMCQLGADTGTSAEVKQRAVVAFYQQMIVVERQLAHIHDEFRLE